MQDQDDSYARSVRRFPAAESSAVAQLDRAPDYESGGQEFESLARTLLLQGAVAQRIEHRLRIWGQGSTFRRATLDQDVTNEISADDPCTACRVGCRRHWQQDPASHGQALVAEFAGLVMRSARKGKADTLTPAVSCTGPQHRSRRVSARARARHLLWPSRHAGVQIQSRRRVGGAPICAIQQ